MRPFDQLPMNWREAISKKTRSPSFSHQFYLCRYFINLVQQSGDLELINILQGMNNPNGFNSQPMFNVTVLIPQQISIQQLGNSQELGLVNRDRDCWQLVRTQMQRKRMLCRVGVCSVSSSNCSRLELTPACLAFAGLCWSATFIGSGIQSLSATEFHSE